MGESTYGRPQAPDAVLFDFDGVIADTEPLVMAHQIETLAQLGVIVTVEEMTSFVGTDGVTFGTLLRGRGLDMTPEEFFDLDERRGVVYASPDLEPMPGVRGLIDSVRASGLSVALVSTTVTAHILMALDHLGLASAFDAVVCGDMVERHKPDPQCYQKALGYLGVPGERGVAFEDSPTGIAAAKAAGLYVVGFEGSVIDQDTSAADETLATFEGLGPWVGVPRSPRRAEPELVTWDRR